MKASCAGLHAERSALVATATGAAPDVFNAGAATFATTAACANNSASAFASSAANVDSANADLGVTRRGEAEGVTEREVLDTGRAGGAAVVKVGVGRPHRGDTMQGMSASCNRGTRQNVLATTAIGTGAACTSATAFRKEAVVGESVSSNAGTPVLGVLS